jgi:hypothetical protein
MNKREFIFPGVILGLVLVIAIGLLLTHGGIPTKLPLGTGNVASSTVSTPTSSSTPATSTKPVSGPTSYYPYGKTTLALNQVAGFKNGVSIRPIAVLEDSRCPKDVECIWAGTTRISVRVSKNNQSEMYEIGPGSGALTVHGTTIVFSSVEPSPLSGSPISPSDYRFTFMVTAGIASAPTGQCYIGGCSSEVCSDKPDAVSNCMYAPSFSCYRTAKCERQVSGKCGWTETAELKKCLANPPE